MYCVLNLFTLHLGLLKVRSATTDLYVWKGATHVTRIRLQCIFITLVPYWDGTT